MKPEELQQDKKYIYISPKPWSKTHTITYTGTARDVKDLLHWFFRTADNSTIFLNADEVKTLSENKLQINDAPTPETDAEAITPSGFEDDDVSAEFARKLERERDEAREKIKRQTDRIRYLEGATNYAKGTPLSIALKERDEARAMAKDMASQFWQAESKAERYCQERDKAREALMKIEDLFIDGTDVYADRETMGIIARNALEGTK